MTDSIQLIHGDCMEQMRDIPENSIDAVITDPPYGLEFMGKEWDKGVPGVHFWAEMLRVLKPGGYLLSFSGTRTYHRMATAIEDAGFEIRDMIEWVYGSGFPKSLSIGKAVDKLQGNEREVLGVQPAGTGPLKTGHARKGGGGGFICEERSPELNITKGTSEWEGWGTALKPAHEPICMARKPLSEKTVAENCLKWGTGGINIDESRVGTDGATKRSHQAEYPKKANGTEDRSGHWARTGHEIEGLNLGRFPANLIHDNSEEVRGCFPNTKSGDCPNGFKGDFKADVYGKYANNMINPDTIYADQGSASRFFKSIIYQAKASKSERGKDNRHPTVKPVALMEYLINMVTVKSGTVLDPFAGSGTTLVAAARLGRKAIGIELEKEYCETAVKRFNQETVQIAMDL